MATDATLRDQALRYAAGALSPSEAAAFEARLASDPQAREAVAEAVRLSAAVLHCPPPTPDPSFRTAACERLLYPRRPRWLSRRAYPGHPLVWTTLGAAIITALVLLTTVLPRPAPPPQSTPQLAPPTDNTLIAAESPSLVTNSVSRTNEEETSAPEVAVHAPLPTDEHAPSSVAELWADMSTPERVEKARDEELRWRQKLRDLGFLTPPRVLTSEAAADTR
jgi:hypothetical protein